MRYVIIGNSVAAAACVEGIRSIDKTGSITIVGEEKYHVYARPLISYLIEGRTDRERMRYRPDGFYEYNGCKLLSGIRAEKIVLEGKKILLSDGTSLSYDKLLIATGSRPYIPRIEGLSSSCFQTFMTLDDAIKLKEKLSLSKKVLILGAGLIGLKCAEAVAGKCASVTVSDMADRILPAVLDKDSSLLIKEFLELKGVGFLLEAKAEKITENEVVFSDGRIQPYDILIVAAGVLPNKELAEDAGISAGRGIKIGAGSDTDINDVYAAGDCTECIGADGKSSVLALLPNAYRQGETAGINMAGGAAVYDDAVAVNAFGFFGRHIATAGSYSGEEICIKTEDSIKKFFLEDGRLKGFILIDDIKRAGIYTKLVRERRPVPRSDLEKAAANPGIYLFSKEERDTVLRGGTK